jgi:hypothetical protein
MVQLVTARPYRVNLLTKYRLYVTSLSGTHTYLYFITIESRHKGQDDSWELELLCSDQNNEVTGDIKKHQTENIQNDNEVSSHV